MKIAVVGISVIVVAVLVVLLALGWQFARTVSALEQRLAEPPVPAMRTDLPAPVRDFALRGLAGGEPARAIRLRQAAQMRNGRGAAWKPISARQTISTVRPGFAWVAAMSAGPVTVVRVLDSYVDGRGLLDVRLVGAYRLDSVDGPDAALGEALRYLAELPWAPDAILLNREIDWALVEDGIVARMQTTGGPAEVVFSADSAGDWVLMQAPGRPAIQADGSIAYLDWRGTFSDYAVVGGRRVPRTGEVGYDYPDGYEAYFQGEITALSPVE